MGKVQRYKRGISAFIASENGQRFFNFAYSIGAAIVIWGALFKILHLPGGNALLSIGMGTEVLMFVLTAFDRPPKEYHWEEVFPELKGKNGEGEEGAESNHAIARGTAAHGYAPAAGYAAGAAGQPMPAATGFEPGSAADSVARMAAAADTMTAVAEDLRQLHETTAALNQVTTTLLESYHAITENSTEISEASRGYVEQMQTLHRNIAGLNTIYELQLRSVSSQIDSIDGVNRGIKDIRDMYEKSAGQSARYCEEAERMARYMQQLNSVYEKMLTAMTINMYRPGMPGLDSVPINNPAEHHTAAQAAATNGNIHNL